MRFAFSFLVILLLMTTAIIRIQLVSDLKYGRRELLFTVPARYFAAIFVAIFKNDSRPWS
jgi:hypothetical protein